jgi:hypothetical protein
MTTLKIQTAMIDSSGADERKEDQDEQQEAGEERNMKAGEMPEARTEQDLDQSRSTS